jgi:hypothetical protein
MVDRLETSIDIVALVLSYTAHAHLVEYGDTVRKRDQYQPYVILNIALSKRDRERGLQVRQVTSIVRDTVGHVYDAFTIEWYLSNSHLRELETNQVVTVNGPFYKANLRGERGTPYAWFEEGEHIPVSELSEHTAICAHWDSTRIARSSGSEYVAEILRAREQHGFDAMKREYF